jgi:hypothetical protein
MNSLYEFLMLVHSTNIVLDPNPSSSEGFASGIAVILFPIHRSTRLVWTGPCQVVLCCTTVHEYAVHTAMPPPISTNGAG